MSEDTYNSLKIMIEINQNLKPTQAKRQGEKDETQRYICDFYYSI